MGFSLILINRLKIHDFYKAEYDNLWENIFGSDYTCPHNHHMVCGPSYYEYEGMVLDKDSEDNVSVHWYCSHSQSMQMLLCYSKQ